METRVPERKKLFVPFCPEDPPLEAQLLEILAQAARDCGVYLVAHPEESSFVAVFGAHQLTVSVVQKR